MAVDTDDSVCASLLYENNPCRNRAGYSQSSTSTVVVDLDLCTTNFCNITSTRKNESEFLPGFSLQLPSSPISDSGIIIRTAYSSSIFQDYLLLLLFLSSPLSSHPLTLVSTGYSSHNIEQVNGHSSSSDTVTAIRFGTITKSLLPTIHLCIRSSQTAASTARHR